MKRQSTKQEGEQNSSKLSSIRVFYSPPFLKLLTYDFQKKKKKKQQATSSKKASNINNMRAREEAESSDSYDGMGCVHA